MDRLFADRIGLGRPNPPITYRADFPLALYDPLIEILRGFVSFEYLIEVPYHLFNPYGLERWLPRDVPFPDLYSSLKWFHLLTIVEKIYRDEDRFAVKILLLKQVNQFFIHVGIGWQLVQDGVQLDQDGLFVARGDEGFSQAIDDAVAQLQTAQRPTAADRIQSALRDLSVRPKPDTFGAISHGTSAVECVLHDITGEDLTLGQYLKRHPDLLPETLKEAMHKVFGYASAEGARHGKERTQPSFEIAQFVVTTCAAVCSLLNATNPKK
jgi:hypothetical protein